MFPSYYQSLYSVQDPNTGEWVPWNDNKRYGAIVNFNWAKNAYIHHDAEQAAQYRVWRSNYEINRIYDPNLTEEQRKVKYFWREPPRATIISFNSKTLEITVKENAGDPLV